MRMEKQRVDRAVDDPIHQLAVRHPWEGWPLDEQRGNSVCRGPQGLGEQVRIGGTDTAGVNAALDPGAQGLVGGPRPAGLVGLAPTQQKCDPVVVGIFQTEGDVRVHATLQNGNRIFIRLRNNRG